MFFGIHKKPWFGMIFGVKFLSWKWCWCNKITNIRYPIWKNLCFEFSFLVLDVCPALSLPGDAVYWPAAQQHYYKSAWKITNITGTANLLEMKTISFGQRSVIWKSTNQRVSECLTNLWKSLTHHVTWQHLHCYFGFISWYWGNIFISQSHINRVWATSMSEWVTQILIHRSIVNFLAKTV